MVVPDEGIRVPSKGHNGRVGGAQRSNGHSQDTERAYEHSLAIRQARRDIKEMLKSGELSLEDAIEDQFAARGMKVRDLLRALPSVSHTQADEIMQTVGLQPTKKVFALKRSQLEKLLRVVKISQEK